MRVAAIQLRSTNKIAPNCTAVEELVRVAAKEGATYIQTPEMTGILEKGRKRLFSEITSQDQDQLVALAAKLASELGIWLHIGSHAIRVGDEKAANRAFLFSPDGVLVCTYDKIHMFDVDLDNGESWRESKVYRPGNQSRVIEMDDTRLGLSICYDIRFPHLYRGQALAGAHILTAPAAFTRQTGRAHWHVLMRSRAIENGAFVIAAAQGGDHDDGRETFGHSLIINPWGAIIAEIDNEEPGFVVADLELNEVEKARGKIPNLANSRDFVFEAAAGKFGAVA
ncbi:MAG: carbon-nitrogen hydrolase family protein [Rhizobiaceae bacterium]